MVTRSTFGYARPRVRGEERPRNREQASKPSRLPFEDAFQAFEVFACGPRDGPSREGVEQTGEPAGPAEVPQRHERVRPGVGPRVCRFHPEGSVVRLHSQAAIRLELDDLVRVRETTAEETRDERDARAERQRWIGLPLDAFDL